MADQASQADWLQSITSLPPQLQGIAIFAVFVGVGLFLGRRFLTRLVQDQPEPKVLAVGDPTTFTDMGPIKELLEQVGVLTLQEQKNEYAIGALAGAFGEMTVKLSQLIDIAGQMLIDQREEREQRADDELREKYREEGRELAHEEIRRTRAARRRRAASKKTST